MGAHGHAGHRLNATADSDVAGAGLDQVGGEVDCLLGAPALPVNGRRRDGVREVRGKRDVAGDVDALLANLVDAAEDNVIDHRGLDAGALDQLVEDHGAEVVWVDAGKNAGATTHGRADRFDYDYFSHGNDLRIVCLAAVF